MHAFVLTNIVTFSSAVRRPSEINDTNHTADLQHALQALSYGAVSQCVVGASSKLATTKW